MGKPAFAQLSINEELEWQEVKIRAPSPRAARRAQG